MNIKHVMRNLSPEAMKVLMAHFEAETQHVEDYDEKLVIGVNMLPENFPNHRFIEVQGAWSLAEKL